MTTPTPVPAASSGPRERHHIRRAAALGLAATLGLLTAAAALLLPASARAATTASGLTPGEGTGKGWCTEYGAAGVTGLYSYDNVWACGPNDTTGPTPFDSNGTASFECVELSERFLWAIDGLAPIFDSSTITVDGADLVSLYHAAHPSIAAGSPGPSSLPQPGDVMSFSEGGDIYTSAGHTAVVVSAVNPSGNFTIMSENWNNTAGEETAHIDMSGGHNGKVQLPGNSHWNPASFLETTGDQVAFHAAGGNLWEYSPATGKGTNTGFGMWPGTSPSVTALSGGGYETAWQAAGSGDLWTTGSAGPTKDWGLGMMAGTSPAIAGLTSGRAAYEIAFQASDGGLYLTGSTGNLAPGLPMYPGTSPAITALPNGGYEVAYVNSSGALALYGTAATVSPLAGINRNSSPAIASQPNGGFEVAYQSETISGGGDLFVYSSATGTSTDTGFGMVAATSPSITALTSGGYETAWQAAGSSDLWTTGPAGTKPWPLVMPTNTSPAIAGLASDGYAAAFQASGTGWLYTTGTPGTYTPKLSLAGGTRPSVAGAYFG